MNPKILIAFYSTYGTNHRMAQVAADAAASAGAEVRLRRFAETAPREVVEGQDAWKAQLDKMADIPELRHDDMEWADGYLISVPTRFGSAPSQAQVFFDTLGGLWASGKLANKTFSAMTSAQNPHGGQETTLQSLYVTAMHWGTVIVPTGYSSDVIFGAGGNPYGTSVTSGDGVTESAQAAIEHQARRLVEYTGKLV